MSKSIETNVANNADCVTINKISLRIKEYKGQRVVTFRDIDAVHERPDGTARRNFNTNREYFTEGVDFFKVCADEIRTRKIMDISSKAQEDITLITESGYFMLVKSFTDNLSWQVQRELVKAYFKVKEIIPAEQEMLKSIQNMQNEIAEMKAMLEAKPAQPNYWLWKKHVANVAVNNVACALIAA